MTTVLPQGNRTSAHQVRNGAKGAENRIPHRTSIGVRGAVRNEEVRSTRCGNEGGLIVHDQGRPSVSQECMDHKGDIVVGLIRKSARKAIELRIRTISGDRLVLARVCTLQSDGTWRPMFDNARRGISIQARVLSETIDLLERAEDILGDEGALG